VYWNILCRLYLFFMLTFSDIGLCACMHIAHGSCVGVSVYVCVCVHICVCISVFICVFVCACVFMLVSFHPLRYVSQAQKIRRNKSFNIKVLSK